MDFDHFALARDLFYLSALFFGAGAGSVLRRYRKAETTRSRNRYITLGLILFSLSLASLCAAIIISNGRVFLETSLYPYFILIVVILIAAFQFPRAAGFPLVIAAGIFVVWLSYICLRFPLINDSDNKGGRLRITREANGLVYIIPVTDKNTAIKSFPPLTIQSGENVQILEFTAFSFSFPKAFPVIGGVPRGDIAEIRSGDEVYYTTPHSAPYRFFPVQQIPAKLDLKKLRAGEALAVFLSKTDLVLR